MSIEGQIVPIRDTGLTESATQSRSGAGGVKSRRTQSGNRGRRGSRRIIPQQPLPGHARPCQAAPRPTDDG